MGERHAEPPVDAERASSEQHENERDGEHKSPHKKTTDIWDQHQPEHCKQPSHKYTHPTVRDSFTN